jgi:hypothetical protein
MAWQFFNGDITPGCSYHTTYGPRRTPTSTFYKARRTAPERDDHNLVRVSCSESEKEKRPSYPVRLSEDVKVVWNSLCYKWDLHRDL